VNADGCGRLGRIGTFLPLILGFVLFPFAGQDDKYITFWSARTLATEGAFLNYNGERLEQSSSLLFTVLLGALHAITRVSLPVLAVVLSAASSVVLVWVTGRLARRLDPKLELVTRLFTAFFTPVLYWAFSGTETTLAAALFVGLVDETLGYLDSGAKLRTTCLWLAGYLLVRPESPLVVGAALAALLVLVPAMRGRVAKLGAWTVGMALCIVGARLAYFGKPLPQAPYGRVLELYDVRAGIGYLLRGDQVASGASVVIAVALFSERKNKVIVAFAAAFVLFVIAAGGDWMLGARLLLPLCPLCIVLALPQNPTRASVGWIIGAELLFTLWFTHRYATSVPLGTEIVFSRPESATALGEGSWLERHNRVHARDLVFVPTLKAAILEREGRPVVRSGQAGLVMFTIARDLPGRFWFIDAGCLTTKNHDGDADADYYFGLLREPAGFELRFEADHECSFRGNWLGLECEIGRQILAVNSKRRP
jgi:hypothetical protein